MEQHPILCPCGSNRKFADCCGRYIDGAAAPTAEALMRSRYSAYTLSREDYLLATWHPSTRPAALDLAGEAGTKWLGLQVKRREQLDADHASVEFVARYKVKSMRSACMKSAALCARRAAGSMWMAR